MVKIVGAFLAQRQPFCRFATFPLTGESPVCPPARIVRLFTLKDLIGDQISIERPREHTWVLPYNVKEKYAKNSYVGDIA